jgi:hypothetical protein
MLVLVMVMLARAIIVGAPLAVVIVSAPCCGGKKFVA